MARTTFISLESGRNSPGFWVLDRWYEVYLRFLLLHLEPSPDDDAAIQSIREQWHLASTGYFGGWMPDGMDEAVTTSEGKRAVLAAIDSLTTALRNSPDKLSKDVINLLWQGQYCSWDEDVETKDLLQISDALIALIEGRIATTAKDSVYVPQPD